MEFFDFEIVKMQFTFKCEEESITLGNFYRGRFVNDNILHDRIEDGRGYMYVDFYEG